MNTTAAVQTTDNLKAANIEGARWTVGNKTYGAPAKSYGITDGAGRWMSSDGVNPSYWTRKRTAAEIVTDLTANGSGADFAPEGIRAGWSWIAAN